MNFQYDQGWAADYPAQPVKRKILKKLTQIPPQFGQLWCNEYDINDRELTTD